MFNWINEDFSSFFLMVERKRIYSRDEISNHHRDNTCQGCPLSKVKELYDWYHITGCWKWQYNDCYLCHRWNEMRPEQGTTYLVQTRKDLLENDLQTKTLHNQENCWHTDRELLKFSSGETSFGSESSYSSLWRTWEVHLENKCLNRIRIRIIHMIMKFLPGIQGFFDGNFLSDEEPTGTRDHFPKSLPFFPRRLVLLQERPILLQSNQDIVNLSSFWSGADFPK